MSENDKPAIEGGSPVRENILTFSPPSIGQEEIDAVVDIMRSKWITMGKKTVEFENQLNKYIGSKHTLVVNSCTAALHLALQAHGIGVGDEVIVPAMTFAATVNVIVQCGATPVLADVDPETYNIDPKDIKRKVTKKTKAIIPVHYGGQPCDMNAIRKIAKKHRLVVVEDAAHAIGAEYMGKRLGKSGTVCFSFYATKNMTTGEGGAVATDNKEVAEKIRILRLHGIDKDAWKRYSSEGNWYYEIKEAGWKYNITDMQSALGMVQLKKLDSFILRRREIAKMYDKGLNKSFFVLPKEVWGVYHARHLYPVQLRLDKVSIDRAKFIEAMSKENIQTSVHFIPIHMHPFYKNISVSLPVTESVYRQFVSLPIYPDMTDKDVQNVVDAANKIAEFYKR